MSLPFYFFLSEAIIISLSGVLAPGPISAVIVGKGSTSPNAGAWVAIGHGIVEIPLMIAVFFGVGSLMDSIILRTIIALLGGVFIIWMGIGMLRGIKKVGLEEQMDTRSPVMAGIIFSIGNPYFIIWWVTVGAALILRSVEFGLLGFIAFAAGHWLCDLLWDWFLSLLSFKGGQFFGNKFQQAIFAFSGVMLLFFGGRLIFDGIKDWIG